MTQRKYDSECLREEIQSLRDAKKEMTIALETVLSTLVVPWNEEHALESINCRYYARGILEKYKE
jgi:hypothetical protein